MFAMADAFPYFLAAWLPQLLVELAGIGGVIAVFVGVVACTATMARFLSESNTSRWLQVLLFALLFILIFVALVTLLLIPALIVFWASTIRGAAFAALDALRDLLALRLSQPLALVGTLLTGCALGLGIVSVSSKLFQLAEGDPYRSDDPYMLRLSVGMAFTLPVFVSWGGFLFLWLPSRMNEISSVDTPENLFPAFIGFVAALGVVIAAGAWIIRTKSGRLRLAYLAVYAVAVCWGVVLIFGSTPSRLAMDWPLVITVIMTIPSILWLRHEIRSERPQSAGVLGLQRLPGKAERGWWKAN
jgi:hypothetical protein